METLTHSQLSALMGMYFIDRGWVPAETELHVGAVEGGGHAPEEVQKWIDEADDEKMKGWYRRIRDRAWMADVAGMCYPNYSKLKVFHLQQFARQAANIAPLTWLVEVKVQRSDFLKDDKWDKPPQTNLQFLAYPKDLIAPDEIPEGWIGLELRGKQVRKHAHRAKLHEVPEEQRHSLMGTLLWALWWRKKEEVRDRYLQAARRERSVRHDARKVGDIISATVDYLDPRSSRRDKSLIELLRYHGIRRSPPSYVVDRAERVIKELRQEREA